MVHYTHGDLIASSEPFAYALNASERGLRCDFCFRNSRSSPLISLRPCSKWCKICFYCNSGCERNAWESFHRDECTKLSTFCRENTPTDIQIFFARLVCKVLKNRGLQTTDEVCNISRCFDDLKSHVEEIMADEERMKQFKVLERFVSVRFLELQYDITLLLSIFGKMVINMYAICDAERRPIGKALYLGVSIFDHSCEPDAVAIFSGTTINIRAIKDFDCEGPRDIFVDYVDPISQTSERQKNLMQDYYFMCHCNLCLNEDIDGMKKTLLKVGYDADVSLANCLQFLNSPFINISLEEKQRNLTRCYLHLDGIEGLVTEGHIYRIWLLRMAFDLAFDLHLWKECLLLALQLLKYYKMYYINRYYPAFGIHLFKVGKIQFVLGKYCDATSSLLQAKNLLIVCYDKHSELLKDIDSLLRICKVEMPASEEITFSKN